MKLKFFGFFLMVFFGVANAQAPLSEGAFQLNGGFGFSNHGLPVYVGLDYGVHPDITIGGELSYRSFNRNWSGNKYKHSVTGISGNANYHFNRILNISNPWNFYAGLNLGYFYWNNDRNYGGSHSSGLGLGLQVGGRYYFNDKIGLNLEFGGGNAFSGGKIGVSIKL